MLVQAAIFTFWTAGSVGGVDSAQYEQSQFTKCHRVFVQGGLFFRKSHLAAGILRGAELIDADSIQRTDSDHGSRRFQPSRLDHFIIIDVT